MGRQIRLPIPGGAAASRPHMAAAPLLLRSGANTTLVVEAELFPFNFLQALASFPLRIDLAPRAACSHGSFCLPPHPELQSASQSVPHLLPPPIKLRWGLHVACRGRLPLDDCCIPEWLRTRYHSHVVVSINCVLFQYWPWPVAQVGFIHLNGLQ